MLLVNAEEDELPELTPEILDDDELLAEAVDLVVLKDQDARRTMQDILAIEELFREMVGADFWGVYLQVDELKTARFSELLLTVARWGFRNGVKNASRPPRST